MITNIKEKTQSYFPRLKTNNTTIILFTKENEGTILYNKEDPTTIGFYQKNIPMNLYEDFNDILELSN